MGVTKQEVYEYFKDNQWHTKKELCARFDLQANAIEKRLRELAKDGVFMANSNYGLKLINPGDVATIDDALVIENMTRWMIGIVTRQAMSAKTLKKLMGEARKLLPKSDQEKQIVRRYLVQLTNLIDWDESE